MASQRMELLVVLVLGLVAAASAVRHSARVEDVLVNLASLRQEQLLRVVGDAEAYIPKGLHDMFIGESSLDSMASVSGGTEGVACTWQEVFPGVNLCMSNWKQLNKTLTPANDVSRAAVNLFAKAYVCGVEADAESCSAVKHCMWDAGLGMCQLSKFYYPLLYACHGSTVRDVSICIDSSEEVCAADQRCKWFEWPQLAQQAQQENMRAVCLPASTPTKWSMAEVMSWLVSIFKDEAHFLQNWGDCPTSHAWLQLTGCSKHHTAPQCTSDDLCAWVDFASECALKPDEFVQVLWGGDEKTVEVVEKRQLYCNSKGSEATCVKAMPNFPRFMQVLVSV